MKYDFSGKNGIGTLTDAELDFYIPFKYAYVIKENDRKTSLLFSIKSTGKTITEWVPKFRLRIDRLHVNQEGKKDWVYVNLNFYKANIAKYAERIVV